jgi:hypothetical protein
MRAGFRLLLPKFDSMTIGMSNTAMQIAGANPDRQSVQQALRE